MDTWVSSSQLLWPWVTDDRRWFLGPASGSFGCVRRSGVAGGAPRLCSGTPVLFLRRLHRLSLCRRCPLVFPAALAVFRGFDRTHPGGCEGLINYTTALRGRTGRVYDMFRTAISVCSDVKYSAFMFSLKWYLSHHILLKVRNEKLPTFRIGCCQIYRACVSDVSWNIDVEVSVHSPRRWSECARTVQALGRLTGRRCVDRPPGSLWELCVLFLLYSGWSAGRCYCWMMFFAWS